MSLSTKTNGLILVLLGSLFLLMGCEEEKEPLPETESVELEVVGEVKQGMSHFEMVQDRKTGCLYILRRDNYSPYFGEDGEVKGCKSGGLMN